VRADASAIFVFRLIIANVGHYEVASFIGNFEYSYVSSRGSHFGQD
jgi:hypothetical protein